MNHEDSDQGGDAETTEELKDSRELEQDSSPSGTPMNRRSIMKYALVGATTPPLIADQVQAQSTFVDILGVDPSNYPNILLNISVDSEAGRNGELTEGDFTITEEGVEKVIENFNFSSSTADIAFVFDDTGSMGNEIGTMKTKVKELTDQIEAAGIDSRYALVSFKDNVDEDLGFTESATDLKISVDDLFASGGGDGPEDNFDAIETALSYSFRETAQKVIIDITDNVSHYEGDGSGFSNYTLTEVAEDIRRGGITYIAVAPSWGGTEDSKRELASQTGGLWIDIASADFDKILERIVVEIVTA